MSKYIKLSESNCRNCLRCVRVCPTKAMTYVNHQPSIIESECILCGKCFVVCPHSAKKISSSLPLIKKWLKDGEKVIVSVAPSFAAVWPNYKTLEKALLKLGFYDVQETALGAKIVSEAYTKLLKEKKMKNIISTCCPAVVSLVEKEFPDLVDQLAPVVSPMIAHGKKIKQDHPDAKVVFLTPCIAKQKEAEDPRFKGIIDATLTMPDLKNWFSGMEVEEANEDWEDFEGQITRIYPTPGGVLKTLARNLTSYKLVNVEGIDRVKRTLTSMQDGTLEGYFFEMSSCEESCLGGPLVFHIEHNEWLAQSVIRDHVDVNDKIKESNPEVDVKACWQAEELPRFHHSDAEIQDILYLMGKTNRSKEHDCGACGYETCRDKAIAVLEGKADPKLCLPNALENAQSMSNLIIENTPNGIIVMDKDYNIREINPVARHMLRLDDLNPIGLPVMSVLPCEELEKMLHTNQHTQYLTYHYDQYGLLLSHALTKLDDEQMSFLILMDLTVEETKEKVIKKMKQQTLEITQNVIDDQMRAVQEIASLLGETTAKSKVALTKLMKAMQEND
ncbi:MAG: histidine kinase [Erysipelotrichaceae bacterium]|nr:histidine kinase [Erysipelotrichaceae bacterium]